ncbi:MAG: hypothetical protein ABI822_28980 [Bryobacteraceae bacterium]
MNDEFYIGYLPQAPAGLSGFVMRIVAVLIGLGVMVAILLVYSQAPFAASVFQYQQYRDYTGTIESWPYPMLLTGDHRFLLVAPGKHGFTENAMHVRLKGALIRRDGVEMLEVLPGSLTPIDDAPRVPDMEADLGPMTMTGEIVDSKCYLGVMNPGQGKVHRDCAVRCISGGVPPAFVVRDASGESKTILLIGAKGMQIGEPVQISGRLIRKGPLYVLEATKE